MDSSSSSHYDIVLIGTGLTESIIAAAIAKAGVKVLQIDSNSYYGGDEASFTLDEFLKWTDTAKYTEGTNFECIKLYGNRLDFSRQYALSLAPSLLPSRGALISAVVNSGVARYGGFRLLESISIYSSGSIKTVPSSKEDIFKSKEISIIEKRHLMRFLTFAAGNFEESKELEGNSELPFIHFLKTVFYFKDELAEAISYAIAFSTSIHDTTLQSLKRTRYYLKSAGRYGPSPFLIAPFGGLGELVQGFCRSCAVSGGTYILGHEIEKIALNVEPDLGADSPYDKPPKFQIHLKGIEDVLTTNYVVSSVEHISDHLEVGSSSSPISHTKYAIGMVVIDKPFSFKRATLNETGIERHTSSENEEGDNLDTALLIFPPNSLPGCQIEYAVSVLVYGEQTDSCPRGKHVLYFSTSLPTHSEIGSNDLDVVENIAELLLRPYILKTLTLVCHPPAEPIFSAFYIRRNNVSINNEQLESYKSDNIFISTSLPLHFGENGDDSAIHAEKTFWEIINKFPQKDEVDAFWPTLQQDSDDDEW